MTIILGERSLSRLDGVHPDLVRVVKRAALLSDLDFTVLEGLRTKERQKQLVAQGASQTMNSRHIPGMRSIWPRASAVKCRGIGRSITSSRPS